MVRGVRVTKIIPSELSLVVLVKNWFRVVSVNIVVRPVCRGVCRAVVPGKMDLP